MNLNRVREMIKGMMNLPCSFIYNGPRNQIERFDGMIIQCFPSVFLVRTTDCVIKSFTYNDFIIKNIKIISCKQSS